jgi:hypothetical protein
MKTPSRSSESDFRRDGRGSILPEGEAIEIEIEIVPTETQRLHTSPNPALRKGDQAMT